MDHVKNYFNAYPVSNQCFETSDRLLFHNIQDALEHAEVLNDKKVIPYKRVTPVKKGIEKQKSTKRKAGSLIIKMEAAKTEDELKSLLPKNEKRKSVLATYNKRLQSLQAAEQSVETIKI
ncbi:hypothetical protein FAM09_18270 [Niastella caeni]|uniref:Uncharacterized protein n=1 Tax=Niastella caeni TaxID=2569763 RepID=A0A4S8HQW0_9BACT|nr:hypothetical protein [Niastella caeni]THU36909.1 hypothetical protein FAM09_18270 [Niastella caeni]